MKGLFIDLDGTLADSISCMKQCYYLFLNNFGVDGSEQEFNSLNGPSLNEIVSYLKKKYTLDPSVDELTKQCKSIVEENYAHLSPMEGAEELLEQAKQKDYALVIVTSNDASLAQIFLEKNALSHYINLIIDGTTATKSKPDPAPYLLALEKSNCLPELSFAIEDSVQGATSAINAGLKTFLLTQQHVDSDYPTEIERHCIFIERLASISEII